MDSIMSEYHIFFLPGNLLNQLQDHVSKCLPNEGCGLIIGRINGQKYQAQEVIPITNILNSPSSYRMDPEEQLRAFEYLETMELELVGIYHSHPNGPEVLSMKDVEESYYPESIYLILYRQDSTWICKAFLINNSQVSEVKLIIKPEL